MRFKGNKVSNCVEAWSTKILDISKCLYYSRKVRNLRKGEQKMEYKKSFFGKTIIDSSDYEESNDNEKFELEYYETHNMTGTCKKEYGIEIVKKRKKDEKFNIESKIINNISDEEKDVNKLLEILMLNKVTPITVDDVISDISVLE